MQENLSYFQTKKPSVGNKNTPYSMRANYGTSLNDQKYKMYKFSKFRNNNTWNHAMSEITDHCLNRVNNQDDLDTLYNSTCDTLLRELDTHLHFSVVGSQSKKSFKNIKLFLR